MFTALRSRLWLSYAIVITIALGIATLVILAFVIRNPVFSRQTQERLKAAQNSVLASPNQFIENPSALDQIKQTYNVRLVLFDSGRNLIFDSNPNDPKLPFPRRNIFGRVAQIARDGNGQLWLYTFKRLSQNKIIVVAAPRPRVPLLNAVADALLVPVLEGGLIALFFSLILAYVISRWVADPLQEVVHAAQVYPSQEMKAISPRGPHDVQDLTRTFNSMIARVESSQKSQREFVANVSHEL